VRKTVRQKRDRRFSRFGLLARGTVAVAFALFLVLLYLLLGAPSDRLAHGLLQDLVAKHFAPGSGFDSLDLDLRSGELRITGIRLEIPPDPDAESAPGEVPGPCLLTVEFLRFSFGPSFERWAPFGARQLDLVGLDLTLDQDALMAFVDRYRRETPREPRDLKVNLPGVTIRRALVRYGRREIPLDVDARAVSLALAPHDTRRVIDGVLHCGEGLVVAHGYRFPVDALDASVSLDTRALTLHRVELISPTADLVAGGVIGFRRYGEIPRRIDIDGECRLEVVGRQTELPIDLQGRAAVDLELNGRWGERDETGLWTLAGTVSGSRAWIDDLLLRDYTILAEAGSTGITVHRFDTGLFDGRCRGSWSLSPPNTSGTMEAALELDHLDFSQVMPWLGIGDEWPGGLVSGQVAGTVPYGSWADVVAAGDLAFTAPGSTAAGLAAAGAPAVRGELAFHAFQRTVQFQESTLQVGPAALQVAGPLSLDARDSRLSIRGETGDLRRSGETLARILGARYPEVRDGEKRVPLSMDGALEIDATLVREAGGPIRFEGWLRGERLMLAGFDLGLADGRFTVDTGRFELRDILLSEGGVSGLVDYFGWQLGRNRVMTTPLDRPNEDIVLRQDLPGMEPEPRVDDLRVLGPLDPLIGLRCELAGVPLGRVSRLLPMPQLGGAPALVRLDLDRADPFSPLTGWGLVESEGWRLDPWRFGATRAGIGVTAEGLRWHGEIGGNGRMTCSGWIEPGFEDVQFRFSGRDVEFPAACVVLEDEENGDPYFRAPLRFDGQGSYDGGRFTMRAGFRFPWLASGANLLGPGRGSLAMEEDLWRLELEPVDGQGRIRGLLFADGGNWPLWLGGRLDGLRVRQCMADENATLPRVIEGQWAELTGDLWIRGPGASPERLALGSDIRNCTVSTTEDYRLDAEFAFPLLASQGVRSFSLPRVAFRGPAGSRLSAVGRFSLEGAQTPTDLEVLGRIDLAGLGLSDDALQVEGQALGGLQLGGFYPRLTQSGQLDLTGGQLTLPEIHFACTDIEAAVSLEPDRLDVLRMSGRIGGGPVDGSGTLAFDEDYAAESFRFEASGRDMVLAYPEKVSTLFDADLVLEGDRRGHALSGRGLIRRTVYSGSVFLEEETDVPVEEPVIETEGETDWLGRMALEIALEAPENLFIRSEEGTVQFTGSLEVGQSFADPRITGSVTSVPGGRFLFRDIEYDVEEARVDFVDPTGVMPVLYLKASTTVDTYLITLVADGPLEDLSFEVTSVPRLNDRDIISLLAFGRLSSEMPGIEGATMAGSEVTAYFSGGFTDELKSRMKETFGLTRFEIQPMFLEGTTDPTARITVGKDLSDDLFFTYSTSLTAIEDSLVLLRYRIDRRLALLGSREQDGSYGADFQYRTSMSFAQGKDKGLWESLTGRSAPGSEEVPGGEASSEGQEVPRVGEVEFTDAEALPQDARTLARRFKLKSGDPLDARQLVDDRERLIHYLIKRGHLRCSVSLDRRERVDDEGRPVVDLVWTVAAGPRLEVVYQGGRVPIGVRGRIRKLWSGEAFFDDNIRRASDMLIDHFRSRGFPDVVVRVEEAPEPDGKGRTALAFIIEKGSAAKIGTIEVTGNTVLSRDEVVALLEGAPDQLPLESGMHYVEDQVSLALARVRSAYRRQGYNGVRLDHHTGPPQSPGGEELTVPLYVNIDEGLPEMVESIRFTGLNGLNEIDLRNRFIYQEGEPYDASQRKEAEAGLVRFIDGEGFIDARLNIDVTWEDRVAHRQGPVARRILITVEEGRRYLVDHWRFSGNVLTDNRVVRQEMVVRPGEPLSRFAMLQSQRNLYRTGLFDQVVISHEPLPGPLDEPLRVRLLVEMEERDNLQLTGGVGYDTEERLRGYLQFNNLNFMGARRILGLQLRGSSKRQRLQLTGTETRFLNRSDMEATVVAFAAIEQEESYDISRLSASFQVDWEFSPRWRFLYGYNFEANRLDEVRVFEDVIEDREETVRISRLRLSPIYDARDDIFNPSRGLFVSGELESALDVLGSEVQFLRSLWSGSYHQPLFGRTVWVSSLRLGLMGWPGSDQYIPLSERFYAGGSNTVRGFPLDRLGPLDPKTGLPLGGEALLVFNQEVRFPLYGDLGASLFVDVGNVYLTVQDMFDGFDLRYTAGLGMRYRTPVGPVRMEYGWVLDREEGEGRGEFYLSIGNAF